jgi:hypothetical protein
MAGEIAPDRIESSHAPSDPGKILQGQGGSDAAKHPPQLVFRNFVYTPCQGCVQFCTDGCSIVNSIHPSDQRHYMPQGKICTLLQVETPDRCQQERKALCPIS